jgi:hypothetical protein
MDSDTFVRLLNGRGDPLEILESGAVRLRGDEELGRAIVEQLNVMF